MSKDNKNNSNDYDLSFFLALPNKEHNSISNMCNIYSQLTHSLTSSSTKRNNNSSSSSLSLETHNL